jgi:type II secretory pathway predicted ATPase ExeA
MDIQTLEELRLLSNINVDQSIMLQLVLVGQPELVEKLTRPELVQFSQRISIEYHLLPLSYKETEQYIHYRLKVAGSEDIIFHPSACAALHYYSGGIPRLINNLGDLALVFAFAADKKKINWKIIVDVISERTTGGIKRFEGKVCLTPNIMERAAEDKKLCRALIEETGVDISKDL